jgi:hypothetical protein
MDIKIKSDPVPGRLHLVSIKNAVPVADLFGETIFLKKVVFNNQ